MACKYICDGCGKEEKARQTDEQHGWEHPHPKDWFQRSDEDGIQDACSRECIKLVAEKTGKTSLVLPI